MEWLLSLGRMAGTSTPFTAWLVQLQSEKDTKEIRRRLDALEDPISALHPDVKAVSHLIYGTVKATGETFVEFSDADRDRFSRALAVLAANGQIQERGALGKQRFELGVFVTNPNYVLYLAAQFEDAAAMERLLAIVEAAKPPVQLLGRELAVSCELPLPVIDAIFDIFEARGFGLTSNEIGSSRYIPTV